MSNKTKSRINLSVLTMTLNNFKSKLGKPAETIKKRIFSTNGLLITLMLGIFVNILSDQLNEIVARQRYQELLSFELRSNLTSARNMIGDYDKRKSVVTDKYISDEVYRAGLSNGYILTIESETLSAIVALYDTIPMYNKMLNNQYEADNTAFVNWLNCLNSWKADINLNRASLNDNQRCKFEAEFSKETKAHVAEFASSIWNSYYDVAATVSAEFNPTQRRMRSIWLKYFMGNESLEFLK